MNAIANATRAATGVDFTTTPEQMRNYYEHPSDFDSARDVAVVELDGRIVGYVRGGIHQEVAGPRVYEVLPFLDPAISPTEVLPIMLWAMEDHLRELAATDPAGEKVLQTFGGDSAPEREVNHSAGRVRGDPVWLLRWSVRTWTTCPTRRSPLGFEIREVRPEHLRQIWDAATEAFRDEWGFSEPTDEDYERYLTDPVESDTSLWRVAWDGDEVGGQVRSYINPVENERYGRLRGYTESISVRRPWRRRGLARALIGASFPLLRARGMTEAALGVDTENVSGALRVYEGCGFRQVSRTATYRKPLVS